MMAKEKTTGGEDVVVYREIGVTSAVMLSTHLFRCHPNIHETHVQRREMSWCEGEKKIERIKSPLFFGPPHFVDYLLIIRISSP